LLGLIWRFAGGGFGAGFIDRQIRVREMDGVEDAGEVDVEDAEGRRGRRRVGLGIRVRAGQESVVIWRHLKGGALLRERDARVGDDAVDGAGWAEREGGFEKGELARPGGDVEVVEVVVRVAACGAEGGDEGFAEGVVEVADDDVGAVGGPVAGEGGAKAGGAACDEDGQAGEGD